MRMSCLFLAAACALLLASQGEAGVTPVAPESALSASLAEAIPGCACEEQRSELEAYQAEIASAASLEEARELAVAKTRLARRALRGARFVAPFSARIAQADEKLVSYEEGVARAETPRQAAEEFGELVQLASLSTPVLADVDIDVDDDGCSFSGGEIIAIVLGFLFGIIPGIILLILLC